MPDNQQRAKAAGDKGENPTPDTPSTGRRGSHPHAEAESPHEARRSARKQHSLRDASTPIEQGGDS